MKAKLVACLTAFALAVSGGGITALAEEVPQETNPVTTPVQNEETGLHLEGEGTKDRPYLIQSADDLKSLAASVNNKQCSWSEDPDGQYYDQYFQLTTNLDLSDFGNWTPIGISGGAYFAGNFDGDGHIITGVKSSGLESEGLFGWVVHGHISNLIVDKAEISGESDEQSFAGALAAVVFDSTVENCEVRNSVVGSSRTISNSHYAGSLVGCAAKATFEKCASVRNEISVGADGFSGGFVGCIVMTSDDNFPESSYFSNCYSANCVIRGGANSADGMFLGGSQFENADLKSCFVYNNALEIDEGTPAYKAIFLTVVASAHYAQFKFTDCYYYVNGSTEVYEDKNCSGNIPASQQEFKGQILVQKLGEAFEVHETDNYPVLKPADPDKEYYVKDCQGNYFYSDTSGDGQHVYEGGWQHDEQNHWRNCIYDHEVDKAPHTGGEATTTQRAVCKVCGAEYGELKPENYAISVPETKNGKVAVSPTSAAPGTRVIVTVTSESGYELSTITAVDGAGKEIPLTENSDGTYSFTQPSSDVTISATFERTTPSRPHGRNTGITVNPGGAYSYSSSQPASDTTGKTDSGKTAPSFTDIPKNSGDLNDAVAYGVSKGFIKGTSATTFSPNAPVTRAQYVAFLYRLAGSPNVKTKANFTDIDGKIGGADFADAISWAVENKIAIGYKDGTFRPGNTVTRAEAVAFLHRYVKKGNAGKTAGFSDVKESAWYAADIAWAAENKITLGRGDGTFGPQDLTNRGQAVRFIYRAVRNIK